MRRLCLLLLLASGCGESTTAPYLYATSVVDPVDPFVIRINYEPSAGHVDSYAVEARAVGGAFTDLPLLQPSSEVPGAYVDLTQVAPNGGAVELRIRADPGAFESNVVQYDPGPSLSTVSVSAEPDAATNAFLVHFGNRNGQVSLQRRVTNGGGTGSGAATGPYVTVATGSGLDTLYADTDLSAYVDGALYEYQAISSTPGAIASSSAQTNRTPLNAPSLVSYLPGAAGAATVVVRNNSAFAVSIDLEALRADGTFLETIGFAAPVAPGATASIAYPPIADSLAHFGISVNSGVAGGSLDIWAALQPLTAPLQPTVRTLQAGYSAARDAAGDFCIVEALSNNAGGFAGSAVFAPGAPADPLVISIQDGVKCLFDSSNRTHVIWYQPGSPGTVMHAQHDGTAWKTEVVASPSSLLPHGPDSPQSDVAFDFGLDGTLFSAWYVDTKTIELATRVSNGTWTVEDIPASPEYGFLAVSGDESGTPHLLTLEFFGNYHLFKGASGWTAEAIAPQFQISDCTNAVMSVAAGVVSFVSNEEDNQFRPTFVRGNSSGWEVTDLGITGLGNISRSADGHAFIAVGNENGQQSTIVIVRDGAVTSSTVPSDARAAGFSANGKAWALVWTDAHAVTAASPADAIATVVFDEQ